MKRPYSCLIMASLLFGVSLLLLSQLVLIVS
jgi:hypothetical protein